MRELTFVRPGCVQWRDVPAPTLEAPTDALVRPLAATTCDLDAFTLAGKSPLAALAPFAFGHEFVAEVSECGDQVRGVSPGDRVVVPFQISCGACERCDRNHTGSCASVPPRSMYGFGAMGGAWGGAFSDLVRVPFADAMLVALPNGVAAEQVASLSDNLPDGYRTVAPHLAERPGADVLVIGGGASSIPLYAVAIARALGAGSVVYCDQHPARLAIAERLGAEVRSGELPSRAGEFAISVDASAERDGLVCALRSLEPGGVCTSIGIYYEDVALPLLDMYTRGVRFHTGRVDARADIPAVLELVRDGRIAPELVNSEVLDWEDAPRALADPSFKPVFVRHLDAAAHP